MWWVKFFALCVGLYAIVARLPQLAIMNSDGDALLALQRFMESVILSFGMLAYIFYEQHNGLVKKLDSQQDQITRAHEQIRKLQGWD